MKSILYTILLTAMTACAISLPQSGLQKRDSSFQLYAYGGSTDENAIGGLPLTYNSGLAYLGNATATTSSDNMTMVSFNMSDNTLKATNKDNEMYYITTDTSALKQTGFTATANSSVTTTNFTMLGEALYWVNETGEYQTYFYARNTSTDGVYQLLWGADGQDTDDVTPVALRSIAPTTAD